MPRPRALLATMAVLALPAASHADDVMVFAAASMQTALDEVAAGFEAATGDRVTISYAGSSVLARQIIGGAPADIFISASTAWMDEVAAAGDVVAGTRRNLLGSTLVLIAHDREGEQVTLARGIDLAGMLGGGRLAMALVDSVPAGQYGKEALQSLGVWDSVAPMVAQTDNVRATLALVATGEAPFGIVYATDAAAEPAVRVAGVFSAGTHAPIVYPAALLANAADAADSAFLQALAGPEADAIFAAHGFVPLD